MSGHGFLSPGVNLIRKHPTLGKKWVFPLLLCVCAVLGGIVSALVRETKAGSWSWFGLLFLGGVAAFVVAYFKFCEDRIKELEKGELAEKVAKAQDDAWASVVGQKFNLAGNILSGILNDVLMANIAAPERRADRLLGLQRSLLRNACEVIASRRALPANALTANWVVETPNEGERAFFVLCYDQHLPDRQLPGPPHQIREGMPGASQAFLTKQIVFVPDTQSSELAQYFPGPVKYRSILSLPMVVGNRVIGVVNFDSEESGVILESDGYLVYDIVSLVALCEHLKQGVKP
jgi:hypothetical protein